jgi:hypothetical protein
MNAEAFAKGNSLQNTFAGFFFLSSRYFWL